jgi:hypothetical protein
MVSQLVELGEKMGTEFPPAVSPRVWWSESHNSLYYVGGDKVAIERFAAINTDGVIFGMMPDDVQELYADDVAAELLAANEDFGKAHVALAQLLEMRPDQNASQVRERVAEIKNAWKHHEKRADEQEKRIETLLTENNRLSNELNKLQADLTKSCGKDENHTPHLHIIEGNTPSFCDGSAFEPDDEDSEYW